MIWTTSIYILLILEWVDRVVVVNMGSRRLVLDLLPKELRVTITGESTSIILFVIVDIPYLLNGESFMGGLKRSHTHTCQARTHLTVPEQSWTGGSALGASRGAGWNRQVSWCSRWTKGSSRHVTAITHVRLLRHEPLHTTGLTSDKIMVWLPRRLTFRSHELCVDKGRWLKPSILMIMVEK